MASFHSVGSLPSARDKLKRAKREGVSSLAHDFGTEGLLMELENDLSETVD